MAQVPEFLRPPFTVEANKVTQADTQKAIAQQPTQAPEEAAPYQPKEKQINVAAPYQAEGFKTQGPNIGKESIIANLAYKGYIHPAYTYVKSAATTAASIPIMIVRPDLAIGGTISAVRQLPQAFQEDPLETYASVMGSFKGAEIAGRAGAYGIKNLRLSSLPKIVLSKDTSGSIIKGDAAIVAAGTAGKATFKNPLGINKEIDFSTVGKAEKSGSLISATAKTTIKSGSTSKVVTTSSNNPVQDLSAAYDKGLDNPITGGRNIPDRATSWGGGSSRLGGKQQLQLVEVSQEPVVLPPQAEQAMLSSVKGIANKELVSFAEKSNAATLSKIKSAISVGSLSLHLPGQKQISEPKSTLLSKSSTDIISVPRQKSNEMLIIKSVQKASPEQLSEQIPRQKVLQESKLLPRSLLQLKPPVEVMPWADNGKHRKRKVFSSKFSPLTKHRSNDVFPVPDLLSATITEAKHPGMKALAPYPTRKVKKEFTRYLGGFNAFFKTAQQRRK